MRLRSRPLHRSVLNLTSNSYGRFQSVLFVCGSVLFLHLRLAPRYKRDVDSEPYALQECVVNC